MILLPALLLTQLSSATAEQLESSARRQVALEYERVGRRTPVRDDALSEAARHLARHALESNAKQAAALVPTTEAISRTGGWDPSPRILILKGTPADEPLHALGKRTDLPSEPATHVGVGVVVQGRGAALVILLSQRRVQLEAFARTYPSPPPPRELCGTLEPGLGAPEVVVTRPNGKVDRVAITKVSGSRFCARVPLPTQGRHTVEVLARGPNGPEVAALFFTQVGAPEAIASADADADEEPSGVELSRVRVVERINALRREHGLQPVTLDPEVTKVAQAYSDQMAKERFFAHVAPDGTSVGKRLRQAGYAYRGAGENLGLAKGPLAAHAGIEHSPGHRKNLLEPAWSRVGIGIATRPGASGDPQTVLTEILVDPITHSADPVAEAYAAIAKARASRKLPKLERNDRLEALAREQAQLALSQEDPKAELPGAKIHDRVFDALDDASSASVDFFIADSPALIDAATRAALKAEHAWVGIGAVRGSTQRFGRDKYWVVVVYAARR